MKIKKLLATFIAAVMTSSCLCTGLTSAEETANDTVKILPLGDSITDGYWEQGAYRKYMYNSLNENGITNIDMVGPKSSNEASYSGEYGSFSYDDNHCGNSGYAIEYITGTETRQGIYQVLTEGSVMETYDPDVVLLQIGTNDILSAYNDGIIDRLDNLVEYILSYMTDEEDVLFVSTIPYFDISEIYSWLWAYPSYTWSGQPSEEFITEVFGYIDSYNAQIKELVAEKQAEGNTHIKFADINSVVDYKTDMYDGCHPNEQGYKKMGEYWSNLLLEEYFGQEGNTNPTEPVVTTTTTTSTTTTTTTTTTSTTTTTTTTTSTTESETTTTTTVTSQIIPGDVNFDGIVSEEDALLVEEHCNKEVVGLEGILTDDQIKAADINEDGFVDFYDVILIRQMFAYKGDVNCDGGLSVADMVLLSQYLMENGTLTGAQAERADTNTDGTIDVFDVILLRKLLVDNIFM